MSARKSAGTSKSGSKDSGRESVYERVTTRILEDLRAGVAPWVRPWGGGSFRNALSGRAYSGVNVWLLSQACGEFGFSDPRFLTPKQALGLGGDFRGESCVRVTFAAEAKGKSPVAAAGVVGDAGGDGEGQRSGGYFFLKEYNLLNVEQVRGLDLPPLPKPSGVVSEFVGRLGSRVVPGGDKAAYLRDSDVVLMPHVGAFASADAFDSVLLHEHVHWSGHASRLSRNLAGEFGSREYAFEELVAELGAAMLCAEFGVTSQLQHSEYVGAWIRVLESDERAFFSASRLASVACGFLLGLGGVGVAAGEGAVE